MSQGKNGDPQGRRQRPHVGRGPVLGELVDDGNKQYAVIGIVSSQLFAAALVADVEVDGPARVYCLPLNNLTFDHETGCWKTPPKASIITDLAGFFKRG